MGMFQAVLIRGDFANGEELISFALSKSSPKGLVQFMWRIFSQLPFQEKEGKLPTKAALLGGFSELPLLGGYFLIGWSSHSCCPCPTHCKDALVNRDLRSLL